MGYIKEKLGINKLKKNENKNKTEGDHLNEI